MYGVCLSHTVSCRLFLDYLSSGELEGALYVTMLRTPSTIIDFGETGSDFVEKMCSGFPSDVLRLLCLNSYVVYVVF